MAEQIITIGGRDYDVACQDGEESFLHLAAGLLDAEARTLQEQIGRQTEARTLLMAGLMLADKSAGMQSRLDAAEARIADLTAEVEALRDRADAGAPQDVVETMRSLAERSEALAARLERAGGAK